MFPELRKYSSPKAVPKSIGKDSIVFRSLIMIFFLIPCPFYGIYKHNLSKSIKIALKLVSKA